MTHFIVLMTKNKDKCYNNRKITYGNQNFQYHDHKKRKNEHCRHHTDSGIHALLEDKRT